MKRKLFAMMAGVFMLAGTSMAQESGFGAKLGLNLASQSGLDDVYSSSGMRTSLHIGAYYNYMISDKFAIQPELVYSAQGHTGTIDFGPLGGGELDVVGRFDYINIPILAKYYFTEGLHLHAGIQLGFNIGAKIEIDGESEDAEDVNGFDAALPIGLGYELSNGLNFTARYNLGLTNTYSGEGDFDIKNNVVQISVGYQF